MKHCPVPVAEPPGLVRYRSENPTGTWAQARRITPLKRAVLDTLAAAQGGLCAYCEAPVVRGVASAGATSAQVEHFVPKQVAPSRELDFANMLACCLGGTARGAADPDAYLGAAHVHCGQRKLGIVPERLIDPRRLPTGRVWDVGVDGRIFAEVAACEATGVDVVAAEHTLDTLGLSVASLRRRREQVILGLDEHLADVLDGDDDDAWRDARLRVLATQLVVVEGRLPAFFSTIRAWGGAEAEGVLATWSPADRRLL